MPVSNTWVNPSAAGALDLSVGSVLTEGWVDSVASNFLVLGGTAGLLHTGAYSVSGLLTASAGLTVTTGNVGIGNAAITNNTLYILGAVAQNAAVVVAGTLQAAGALGALFYTAANVQSVANSDALYGAYVAPAWLANTHTGLTATTIRVTPGTVPAGFTSNIGLQVDAPSGGGTSNFGIRVAGGSPAIQIDAGGIIINGNTTLGTIQGALVITGLANVGTVGAAGAASAMPTPSTYMPITANGTAFKIALFNP
jgi:hypothetical protein